MKRRALLPALPAVVLGCAASTPPPEQPQPAPTGEVAVIDLNANQPPPPAPKKEIAKPADDRAEALKHAQQAGILGVLRNDGSREGEEGELKGNMWGDSIGDSFGAGGLGLAGVGTGGGGRGEGIGIGTIGHGAGTGTGQGFGSGSGRLGGSHSKSPPKVQMGATNVTGRLPPEVIQRIVRQSFGRFRLCYENGLRNSPKLQGRVSVKFVIGKDGAVSSAIDGGSDLPDSGVVSCVIKAFQGLAFPQPEGGGVVVVVYPVIFSPGDDPAAKQPAPAPAPATATPKPASPPPAPAKQP